MASVIDIFSKIHYLFLIVSSNFKRFDLRISDFQLLCLSVLLWQWKYTSENNIYCLRVLKKLTF